MIDTYEARLAKHERIQRENEEYVPQLTVGTEVEVIKDNGGMVTTRVRQAPWKTASGSWIVSVDGISGGYAVERVRVKRRHL